MLVLKGWEKLNNNINILIPAAGKGERSKLPYPKTLFKINNLSILERIIKNTKFLNANISIISSLDGREKIVNKLNDKKINSEIIVQKIPNGMGNAILQYKKSKFYKDTKDILIVWGDIPFVKKSSYRKLIKFHYKNFNTVSILSTFVKNPYTYIKRDKKGKIIEVIETKEMKKKYKYGERDVGVFVINKNIVFKYLYKSYIQKKHENKEHGFLQIINTIVKNKHKVETLPIATTKESKSLNYIKDIK